MSGELKHFGKQYERASRQTALAFISMVVLSLAAIPGIWDESLDRTITELEVAERLLMGWDRGERPTTEGCGGVSPDLCMRYQQLMKDYQIKNKVDLGDTLAELRSQVQEPAPGQVRPFGTQFPWKDVLIYRWGVLALAAFLLYLSLIRENELMGRGLALARPDHQVFSLYQICSFSQILAAPPFLEDKEPSGHLRALVVTLLLGFPCAVFFSSMGFAYLYFGGEMAPHIHLSNIAFSAIFIFLLLGCSRAYDANCLEWVEWWKLARAESGGLPYLGESIFTVKIEDKELESFNHNGEIKITHRDGQLTVSGTSNLPSQAHGVKIPCKWSEAQAVVMGEQLLVRFQFQLDSEQICCLMEINIRHIMAERPISGSYFQLLPDRLAMSGKVEIHRPSGVKT